MTKWIWPKHDYDEPYFIQFDQIYDNNKHYFLNTTEIETD